MITATSRLSDIYESPVLLIVDELDRVHDRSGLASFIKTASHPQLEFMLVGIAQNVSELLEDHRSIERALAITQVYSMNSFELEAIVERATRRLHDRGIDVTFAPEVVRALRNIVSGFPWFVHVLGQESLLQAAKDKSSRVLSEHLAIAVTSLTTNRFANSSVTLTAGCQEFTASRNCSSDAC